MLQLEKDRFIAVFRQQLKTDQHKAWHYFHVKVKHLQHGDMVLRYDSKFTKHPGKLQMHWLGPYVIHFITSGGVVKLQQLDGVMLSKLVNGTRINIYWDSHVWHQ